MPRDQTSRHSETSEAAIDLERSSSAMMSTESPGTGAHLPHSATVLGEGEAMGSSATPAEWSANALYAISRSKEELLATQDAPEPQPDGFYDKTRESIVNPLGESVDMAKYTPNARLMSNEELAAAGRAPQFRKEVQKVARKIFGFELPEKLLGIAVPFHSVEQEDWVAIEDPTKPWVDAFYEEAQQMMQDQPEGAMSIIGKNDCRAFASRLQELIGASADGSASDEVGDRWQHNVSNEKGNSVGEHAATVVAQDGQSRVTLEANVDKDLTKPQFAMYGGSADFVETNKQGDERWQDPSYRHNVDVTPMKRGEAARTEYARLVSQGTKQEGQKFGRRLDKTDMVVRKANT